MGGVSQFESERVLRGVRDQNQELLDTRGKKKGGQNSFLRRGSSTRHTDHGGEEGKEEEVWRLGD